MNRILRRAVLAVSSLGVASGIAMTALPASAGPLPPIHSWGAEAMGPASFPPVAYATPGHTPAVASNANYTNFLTTGMILDRASTSTAYSRVNSPLVNLSFLQATIQADQVTSYCHIGRRGTFGGASIFSGSVSQIGEDQLQPADQPGAQHQRDRSRVHGHVQQADHRERPASGHGDLRQVRSREAVSRGLQLQRRRRRRRLAR